MAITALISSFTALRELLLRQPACAITVISPALQPEGLSQVADLVSFYKENANILREVRDAPHLRLFC